MRRSPIQADDASNCPRSVILWELASHWIAREGTEPCSCVRFEDVDSHALIPFYVWPCSPVLCESLLSFHVICSARPCQFRRVKSHRLKRRRAVSQASSPGKQARQTSGLTA